MVLARQGKLKYCGKKFISYQFVSIIYNTYYFLFIRRRKNNILKFLIFKDKNLKSKWKTALNKYVNTKKQSIILSNKDFTFGTVDSPYTMK